MVAANAHPHAAGSGTTADDRAGTDVSPQFKSTPSSSF